MKKTINQFDTLHDALLHIDSLVEQADHTKGRKEKRELLTEAQTLADDYQRHCERGGNHVQQFNHFV